MLSYIWHSTAALLGIGGLALVGLGAIAYLFPPFRRLAIAAGGGLLVLMGSYFKGVRDNAERERERQAKAEADAVAKGKAARTAAERDVADGVRDGYQRD